MIGKLSKIYISRKKGNREYVLSASLDKEIGLVGDYKSESGDKDRQLVILLKSDRDNIDYNYSDRGLCTKRFQENILIKDFSLKDIEVGTKLEVGESIIEITSIGKKCFKECDLVENEEVCPLKTGSLFGRVIKTGVIKIGDIIVKKKNF